MAAPETESHDIPDDEMPRFVRKCWDNYMDATQDERKKEIESLGFYVGGALQWRPGETEQREGNKRPWLTINRCRPAVDQVSNEARNNPPGPEAEPVGGAADRDGADIMEGLIREYEYRSGANEARVNALTYGCAGGRGVWELATEYAGERTFQQQLVVKHCDDPSSFFYDPSARLPGRSDSMWGGRIRTFTREALIAEYGTSLKVLNRSVFDVGAGAMGWIGDAVGWKNDYTSLNTWTGGARGQGPYHVCEFYLVKIKQQKLQLYSDHVLRFDNEDAGKATPTDDGKERYVARRTVRKYVVTALDTIESTDWYGTTVPHFWVMGPEIWIKGKLYRLSLIDGAEDAQRLLNYTATSMAEITGSMTKAPFIGWEGQFDVTNAQGFNPWDSSNTQMWAYMEVKPVFATDPVTGAASLLPPPQRNTWEAPIARVLELANWAGEQIKAATAVFFEPSLPSAAQVQSGAAIKALQAQTNIGTAYWQKMTQLATELEYRQAAIILPQINDGQRTVTIVRPDTKAELMEINKEFPEHEIDPATRKRKGPDGKLESVNNIVLGEYSLRVKSGPNFETRTDEAISNLTDLFKIAPQLLQAPPILAKFIRMVGQGNPEIESLADAVSPPADGTQSPEATQQQLQQEKQKSQMLGTVVQKLHQAIEAKLPQIEADKWKTAINAIAGIREAEIKAGVDRSQMDVGMLEHFTGLAHETAMASTQHERAKELGAQQATQQSAQSAQDAAQTQVQQEAATENE